MQGPVAKLVCRVAGAAVVLPAVIALSVAAHTTLVHAATLTVMNTNDSGAGSLRGMIAAASSGDSIVFASSANGTISLQSSLTLSGKNLTITGNGIATTIISPANSATVDPIFSVTAGSALTLVSLTVTDSAGRDVNTTDR